MKGIFYNCEPFLLAMLIHAGLGIGLMKVVPSLKRPSTPIEIKIVQKEKPKKAELDRKPDVKPDIAKAEPKPKPKPKPAAPKPQLKQEEPPKPELEKQEQPPVALPPQDFGVSTASVVMGGSSSFYVPVGTTLLADPMKPKKEAAPVEEKPAAQVAVLKETYEGPKLEKDFVVAYPQSARLAGVEGSVILELSIRADGTVEKAAVRAGLGYGLNEAALEAAHKFRFRPALRNGKPVAAKIRYTYTFVLEE